MDFAVSAAGAAARAALAAKSANGEPTPDARNRLAAQAIARVEVSDAVVAAMTDFHGSLRDFQRQSGIDAAVVSRLMNQRHKQGATVATLAQIALALGKTLKITIE